ncbi:hypothetical protein N431DRAFT_218427 [Stipitochalara longipes BDJ]|nr:hypothetical protein N431DRAFT_218427 [Stipitochalara longipes BDJ]
MLSFYLLTPTSRLYQLISRLRRGRELLFRPWVRTLVKAISTAWAADVPWSAEVRSSLRGYVETLLGVSLEPSPSERSPRPMPIPGRQNVSRNFMLAYGKRRGGAARERGRFMLAVDAVDVCQTRMDGIRVSKARLGLLVQALTSCRRVSRV